MHFKLTLHNNYYAARRGFNFRYLLNYKCGILFPLLHNLIIFQPQLMNRDVSTLRVNEYWLTHNKK